MSTQQATELHLRHLTNLLRRRWKLIVACGLIGATIAGVTGLSMPPRYTAKAQIVIDPPKGGNAGAQPSALGMLDDAAVETQVAMLVSDGHLQRVLESFAQQKAAAAEMEQGRAPDIEVPDIEVFKRHIKAFKEHRSRVIGVTYTSTSPANAAAVANRTVQLYLTALLERKRAERSDIINSLKERIPASKAGVERADAALQTYRSKDGFAQASRADMINQQLIDLKSTNQSLSQSADDIGIAETRVRHLQQRLAALQEGSPEAGQPQVSLRELQRQAIMAAQLHDSLLQRQKELLLEWEDHPEVRVLSFASVPNVPSSPNPLLFVLPGLAVAFIGAGLLAVLQERLDRGLRSEQQIKDVLGISCIGLVPKITRPAELRPHEHLLQRPFAPYTEAIRSAAVAALHLTKPQEAPRAFLVTSSIRGEGKTTLALSFAVYAALLQRRVLLIDLDLRNAPMLTELKAAADKGSLDVLRSGRPLAELIRIVPELGLDYLRVRHDSADPIAVMANALPDLLRELRESYDCVVIDSAPLLGTTEARLLASLVDRVLFVVKWGSTRREVVQNALRLLDCSDSRDRELQNRICAVVTQVDLKKHAGYRHGDFGESLFYSKPYPARVSKQS